MRDKHRTSCRATLREPRRHLPCRPAEARRTVESVVAEYTRRCCWFFARNRRRPSSSGCTSTNAVVPVP
ncbi:hypothetical protein ACWDZ8_37315, partial [Streptomyces sp. NPDC003233]